MSAYVVSKVHIDLLVRAAQQYGGARGFRWWRVDEAGGYAGWSELNTRADEWQGANDDDFVRFVGFSQAGQMLVDENVASVGHRYGDCDPDEGNLPGPTDAYYMGPYVYEDPGYVLTPAETFKAIDCLDYQSCEHDGWLTSEAYAFLRSLRWDACRAVDGYEDAVRDWDPADLASRRARGGYANPAPFTR